MLLIFGGGNDFNITRLIKSAEQHDLPHRGIVLSDDYAPALLIDPASLSLTIDRIPLEVTSIFLRDDVLGSCDRQTSSSIYRSLKEWAFCKNIRLFNQGYQGMRKLYNLHRAKANGLSIPKTMITNGLLALQRVAQEPYAVKPILGGVHTELLSNLDPTKLAHNAAAYFVQERLVAPEIRVFIIGEKTFAFHIKSEALDYRTDKTTEVTYIDTPGHLAGPLLRLCRERRLDFAAADFKTTQESGELAFLEVNSGPMFARFDHACKGLLCRSMLDWLLKEDF